MFINFAVNSGCHHSSKTYFSDFLFLFFPSHPVRAPGDISLLSNSMDQKTLISSLLSSPICSLLSLLIATTTSRAKSPQTKAVALSS